MPTLCVAAVLGVMLGDAAPAIAVTESVFGTLPDGRPVTQYELSNKRGTRADIIALGATLRSLRLRDRHARTIDVVLGYDTLADYLSGRGYLGATVGRYSNRIANAEVTLAGRSFRLTANNGANTLHGGQQGFNRALWSREPGVSSEHADSVRLKYVSPDGEEGFPGELTLWVTYTLTDVDELRIEYEARTTATTVVNFTNHSYFSLGGAGTEVLGETLAVAADAFTPTGADSIPTGAVRPVAGTDFDFRRPTQIGRRLQEARDERVRSTHSIDMNLVLRGGGHRLAHVATLHDPTSGITLDLSTTEPGVQLFVPNFPAGRMSGKSGIAYAGAAAVCLEPEHFPDSPHHPQFPSTVLEPGKVFRSESVYRFTT